MSAAAPLLEARGITVRFPGVLALDDVDLAVRPGEVLAVVGENGAGKSTLMRCLAGIQRPAAGSILVDGRAVRLDGARDATALGIALIHQELNLADHLDVGANVFLGREPHRLGLISPARIRDRARPWLERVGLRVDPATPVARLSIGQRQQVEIAKALSADARVLIMDEPTSSLTLTECERLFELVRELARAGTSVVYISHRLGEVEALADRAVVLRDGRVAGELSGSQIGHDALVRLMVGRDVARFYQRHAHAPGDVVLEVRGLRTTAHPRAAVDLAVRAGEVCGLAGLVGAGRTELLETCFGIRPALGGSVRVCARELATGDPSRAAVAGLALVPEDRKRAGLLLARSVRENLALTRLATSTGLGARLWVDARAEAAAARRDVTALGIRTAGTESPVETLSGGNQQKVVLGKWLAIEPRVLLLDEPTRGVDIGGKREIYALVDALAGRGVAVLFASSEMEEVLGLSDRVLVMHSGEIAGELPKAELTEERIMALATGGSARRTA